MRRLMLVTFAAIILCSALPTVAVARPLATRPDGGLRDPHAAGTTAFEKPPSVGVVVQGGDPSTGRIVVGLRRDVELSEVLLGLESCGARLLRRSRQDFFWVVEPLPGYAADAVLQSLAGLAGVRYVQFDSVAQIQSAVPTPSVSLSAASRGDGVSAAWVPNDTYYASQWHLPQIGAPAAWDVSRGANTTVAVIDTGVDLTHPELVGRLNTSLDYDWVDSDWTADDEDGHGTHVAGIIAAESGNASGVAGVAPSAMILPLKVIGPSGANQADTADAIIYAVDLGASVINLSLGGYFFSQAQYEAVAYANYSDVVIVAAAGNDEVASVIFPAAYPGVIGVGATTATQYRAPYSNWGHGIDLVAPGGDMSQDPSGGILSLVPQSMGLYDFYEGTSMAAPVVSGVAALVRSLQPSWSAVAVADQLQSTAKDLGASGYDSYYGFGLVQADDAVTAAWGKAVERNEMAGTSRYDTAVAISQRTFLDGSDTVIIATGANYPDALGGSGLAGAVYAPILLVPKSGTLPNAIKAELVRLGAVNLYTLGGTLAVPDAMEAQVWDSMPYDPDAWWYRLAGGTRYGTAAAVAEEVALWWGPSFNGTVFVCDGQSFADALIAGPLAGYWGIPILLTGSSSLAPETAGCIRDTLGADTVLIVGNTSHVGAGPAQSLVGLPGVVSVGRIGGSTTNSSQMSVQVAEFGEHDSMFGAQPMTWNWAAITTSEKYPDALAGGARQCQWPVPLWSGPAYFPPSPILLTPIYNLDPTVASALGSHRNQIDEVSILGGTLAVSQTTRSSVYQALEQ